MSEHGITRPCREVGNAPEKRHCVDPIPSTDVELVGDRCNNCGGETTKVESLDCGSQLLFGSGPVEDALDGPVVSETKRTKSIRDQRPTCVNAGPHHFAYVMIIPQSSSHGPPLGAAAVPKIVHW